MIQLEKVDRIPQIDLAKYSAMEFEQMRGKMEQIERASEGIWVVTANDAVIIVAGIIRYSLLCPPRLWFMMGREFSSTKVIWHLRILRELLGELDMRYNEVQTFVEEDWAVGMKFAKFCGFTQTGKITDIDGKRYAVMER